MPNPNEDDGRGHPRIRSLEIRKRVWTIAALLPLKERTGTAILRQLSVELDKLHSKGIALNEDIPDVRTITPMLEQLRDPTPQQVLDMGLPESVWQLRQDYDQIRQLAAQKKVIPTLPAVVEVRPTVIRSHRAFLEVTNHGAAASFSAVGKVIEGRDRGNRGAGNAYAMYWFPTGKPDCQISNGGMAWLVVACIGYRGFEHMGILTDEDGGEKAVFSDGLTLARWELPGPHAFSVMSIVRERIPVAESSFVRLEGRDPGTLEPEVDRWHFEDKCILEISLASPSLATPFKQTYHLAANRVCGQQDPRLVFEECPTTIEHGKEAKP
ncbi:MAG: hypothetical protein HYY29_04945 [Chloroflexi bacterium]|nr:hypothetical protein [Chloroflexota bacterium]